MKDDVLMIIHIYAKVSHW